MDFLKIQKEDNLLQEFESQIFWNDLNNSFNFGEISNSDEFVRFLNARSYLMVEKIFLKLIQKLEFMLVNIFQQI